jgi:hypothetical protein
MTSESDETGRTLIQEHPARNCNIEFRELHGCRIESAARLHAGDAACDEPSRHAHRWGKNLNYFWLCHHRRRPSA